MQLYSAAAAGPRPRHSDFGTFLLAPALPAGHINSGPLDANTINAPGTGQLTREKIQDMLDKLDERLILGEITEQKHSELYARLQKKLAELA